MSTLDQLRHGLARAWESVTEGWRELVERAGDALTRFHPPAAKGELMTAEESLVRQSARWGVLAAEVSVNDDAVEVAIEVPGMDAEDFDISVVDDTLVVRGEKRFQREGKRGEFHVMERAYGAFERAVRLPVPVDEAGATARYKRGVLTIGLPRSAAHRPRRITVSRS